MTTTDRDFDKLVRGALTATADTLDRDPLRNPAHDHVALNASDFRDDASTGSVTSLTSRASNTTGRRRLPLMLGSAAAAAALVLAIGLGVHQRGQDSVKPAPAPTSTRVSAWPKLFTEPNPETTRLPAGRELRWPTPRVEMIRDVKSKQPPVLVMRDRRVTLDHALVEGRRVDLTFDDLASARPLAQRGTDVFVSSHGSGFTGADHDDDYRLLVVSEDGQIRQLLRGAQIAGVAISPDGAKLAVSRERAGTTEVVILDRSTLAVGARLADQYIPRAWPKDLLLEPARSNDTLQDSATSEERLYVWDGVKAPRALPGGSGYLPRTGSSVMLAARNMTGDPNSYQNCLVILSGGKLDPTRQTCQYNCWVSPASWSPEGSSAVVTAGPYEGDNHLGLLDLGTGTIRWWPRPESGSLTLDYWEDDMHIVTRVEDDEGAVRCSTASMTCGTAETPDRSIYAAFIQER